MKQIYVRNEESFPIFPSVIGDTVEDISKINANIAECINYLQSQKWCEEISEIKYAFGVGGIIVILLVTFKKPVNSNDLRLWVFGGDLPNAYLVLDQTRTVEDALKEYISLMREWCESILHNRSIQENFPVGALPTLENANSLRIRINYIEQNILPVLQ